MSGTKQRYSAHNSDNVWSSGKVISDITLDPEFESHWTELFRKSEKKRPRCAKGAALLPMTFGERRYVKCDFSTRPYMLRNIYGLVE